MSEPSYSTFSAHRHILLDMEVTLSYVLQCAHFQTDVKSWDVSDVRRCEPCFKGTAVYDIRCFFSNDRYCYRIVHPKHPLHSYHGFVFCFVYYRCSFYLWKHMVSKNQSEKKWQCISLFKLTFSHTCVQYLV